MSEAESERSDPSDDVSAAVREVFGRCISEQKVLALLLAFDKRGLAVQHKILLQSASELR